MDDPQSQFFVNPVADVILENYTVETWEEAVRFLEIIRTDPAPLIRDAIPKVAVKFTVDLRLEEEAHKIMLDMADRSARRASSGSRGKKNSGAAGPKIDGASSSSANTQICSFCGASDLKLKKCSRCRSVYYCSIECQNSAW